MPSSESSPEAALLEQVPAAVITVDLESRILSWNAGAEALYGWTASQAVGQSIRDLIFQAVTPSDEIIAQTHSGRVWEGQVAVRHRDGSRLLVFVRNAPLQAADGTVVGVVGASVDVTHLRGDQDLGARFDETSARYARLQHLTAALVPASTEQEVTDAVLDAGVVALGADAGAVLLLDGDALRFADGRGYPADFHATFGSVALASSSPATEAARRGRSGFFNDGASFDLAYPGLDQDRVFEARAVVPITSTGVTLGVLYLSFREQREFDDAHVQLLHTIASQCGQALERCRLLAAERESSQQQAFLGQASDLLARSLSVPDTLDALTSLLVPAYADWLVVHVREGDHVVCRAVGHRSPGARLALASVALGQPLDLTAEGGASRALRTGDKVLYEVVPAHVRERLVFPDVDAAVAAQLQARTGLSVPMVVGNDVLGALSLGRIEGPAYTDADVNVAEQLAARTAIALTHSRAYQRARDSALTLQRNLLPQHLPDLPGLTFAWRYLPGTEGELVGGDWYDVFPLDHGRVGVFIGDVMGRGVTAAAVMGQLRAMARAYAQAGLRPGAVLSRLDAALPGLQEDSIATLLFLELDPATATVVAANAGHLPALIAPPSGPTRLLEIEPGPPLGAGPGEYPESREVLEHGSTLLLYTDGLVEHREQSLQVGLKLLRAAVDSRSFDDPEQLCDHVLRTLAADPTTADDTALLAVSLHDLRDLRDEASTPFLSLVLEDATGVSQLRGALARRARLWHVPADVEADLVLVTTELCTNALLHVGGPVTATVRLEVDCVRLEVHDSEATQLPLPSLLSMTSLANRPDDADLDAVISDLAVTGTTGRGMQLVAGLTSGWGVIAEPAGKTVWAEVPLATQSLAEKTLPVASEAVVWLRGVPVRLILASAANLDDMVREVLVRADDSRLVAIGAQGRELVAASSRTRDPFRVAARDALARGQRFVDVATTADRTTVLTLEMTMRFVEDMVDLGKRGQLLLLEPGAEITAFRNWWRAEIARQLDGQPPHQCPFPALPPPQR